jgi:hypothetical protein
VGEGAGGHQTTNIVPLSRRERGQG